MYLWDHMHITSPWVRAGLCAERSTYPTSPQKKSRRATWHTPVHWSRTKFISSCCMDINMQTRQGYMEVLTQATTMTFLTSLELKLRTKFEWILFYRKSCKSQMLQNWVDKAKVGGKFANSPHWTWWTVMPEMEEGIVVEGTSENAYKLLKKIPKQTSTRPVIEDNIGHFFLHKGINALKCFYI